MCSWEKIEDKLEFHKVLLIKPYNSNQIDTVSAAKAPGSYWHLVSVSPFFHSGYFEVTSFPLKFPLIIHLWNSQPVYGTR